MIYLFFSCTCVKNVGMRRTIKRADLYALCTNPASELETRAALFINMYLYLQIFTPLAVKKICFTANGVSFFRIIFFILIHTREKNDGFDDGP